MAKKKFTNIKSSAGLSRQPGPVRAARADAVGKLRGNMKAPFSKKSNAFAPAIEMAARAKTPKK